MLQLKTHQANINQIKGHIKAFGPTMFHGDGNMYKLSGKDGDRHSDNNKNLTNPAQEQAQYRVRFDSIAQVPGTVEELNKLLLASKHKEAAAIANTSTLPVDIFEAYDDSEEVSAGAKTKRIAIAQGKMNTAINKATEAKAKADAEGATEAVKKAYQKLQEAADKATEDYNAALEAE